MSKRRSPNAVKEPLNPADDSAARYPDRFDRFATGQTLVTIEVPAGEFHERDHKPLHVEARLTPRQGRALRRLLNGLNSKFGPGWAPRERSYADVLRWLLDQLPD